MFRMLASAWKLSVIVCAVIMKFLDAADFRRIIGKNGPAFQLVKKADPGVILWIRVLGVGKRLKQRRLLLFRQTDKRFVMKLQGPAVNPCQPLQKFLLPVSF